MDGKQNKTITAKENFDTSHECRGKLHLIDKYGVEKVEDSWKNFSIAFSNLGFQVINPFKNFKKENDQIILNGIREDNSIQNSDCLCALFLASTKKFTYPPLDILERFHSDKNLHYRNKPRILIFLVEEAQVEMMVLAKDSAPCGGKLPIQADMLVLWVLTKDMSTTLNEMSKAVSELECQLDVTRFTTRLIDSVAGKWTVWSTLSKRFLLGPKKMQKPDKRMEYTKRRNRVLIVYLDQLDTVEDHDENAEIQMLFKRHSLKDVKNRITRDEYVIIENREVMIKELDDFLKKTDDPEENSSFYRDTLRALFTERRMFIVIIFAVIYYFTFINPTERK